MDIQTFEEATRLHDRYILCEELMEHLSDDDNPKGQKYLDALCRFTREFRIEFMTFVQHRMEESGMAFESLHCCPTGNETTPEQ